jgi:hypothetical protein
LQNDRAVRFTLQLKHLFVWFDFQDSGSARILIILDDMHQIYEPNNRASFLADPTINPILEQEPNCSIVSQLAVCPLLRSPAHHPNSPLLSSPPPTMSIFSGRPSTITTGGDYKVTYQARGKLIDKAVPCHRRD